MNAVISTFHEAPADLVVSVVNAQLNEDTMIGKWVGWDGIVVLVATSRQQRNNDDIITR